jgi:carboxyl-terminal processing protease
MFRRVLTVALATVALAGAASAQQFINSPAQNLFDQATFYLDTQYFGPSQVKISDLVAKYQPQLDTACAAQGQACAFTVAEPILAAMFNELNDGHAYYIPAQALAAERATQNNQASPVLRVGITSAKVSPDSYDRLITDVVEGSPADKAGVLYGDRWTGFNGQPWPTTDQGFTEANGRFTTAVRAGETVTMNLIRGRDRVRVDVNLKGELIQGRPRVKLTVRPDGIGVLAVKDFTPRGTAQAVSAAVAQAQSQNVKGLILDLRGNGGGLLNEGLGTAGAFLQTPLTEVLNPRYNADRDRISYNYDKGVFTIRDAKNNEVNRQTIPQAAVWTGPLAVLVDEASASATERVAYYIQQAKRAPIIGEETGGVANTNTARIPLINGGAAGFPTVRSFAADGTPFPSSIKPDVLIADMLLTLFNTGRDLGLEKALETLGASPTLNAARLPALPRAFNGLAPVFGGSSLTAPIVQ